MFDKCALRLEKVVCEHGKIVANLFDRENFNQRHSAVLKAFPTTRQFTLALGLNEGLFTYILLDGWRVFLAHRSTHFFADKEFSSLGFVFT